MLCILHDSLSCATYAYKTCFSTSCMATLLQACRHVLLPSRVDLVVIAVM